jgi:hypothetical protein
MDGVGDGKGDGVAGLFQEGGKVQIESGMERKRGSEGEGLDEMR